ncbi:hypothetical protein IQ254_09245 [Nodosilinea sp. LEGE 07088]|uniref:hypothetical protein n=1 Tax=Nodosilinea sp. LEGE 07088 TaxID=2777968 RepID=UPI00187ED6DF|nr:hypothetical protein [Nodosilinea sp. LEGE 07088]MBE9137391.1 hypothetical protein [Nodosilinea sp. LEGE 07088]
MRRLILDQPSGESQKSFQLFRHSGWQLTAWYTGVMTVVLGLSGLGGYEARSPSQPQVCLD